MVSVKDSYLFVYNSTLCLGWAYVLHLTYSTLGHGGTLPDIWQATEAPLKLVQTAAIMEVFHAATGIVRSPVMITATQVASRLWVLWGIIIAAPSSTTTQTVPTSGLPILSQHVTYAGLSLITLFTAWCLSEIIRYGFFAFKAIGLQPFILLWLRYTGFIVFYPLGVSSELSMVWLALPELRRTAKWSVAMPNPLNFSFAYWVACLGVVAIYLPGFPMLYGYMLAQRRKLLGGGTTTRSGSGKSKRQ